MVNIELCLLQMIFATYSIRFVLWVYKVVIDLSLSVKMEHDTQHMILAEQLTVEQAKLV